jgi:arylsulfatase A-like enzyme
MKALKTNGLDDNALVIMTSDNGPWTVYGNHSGKTPFREAKGTGFDGGTRSACIMRYPGKIKAGTTSKRMFCTIDLHPTIAKLAGSKPRNEVDGMDVWDLITDKAGAQNPHKYYAFSTGQVFEGVISGDGRWKLHLPHSYRQVEYTGDDGKPGKYRQVSIDLSLFDMEADPYEKVNVLDKFPDVAKRMQAFAEEHRQKFFASQG